jgi:acyl-CoA reductase-like NAD-dependent aldehyde dehydrogenase
MNEAVRSTKLQDMPMLIGGKLVASESGRWMESVNPATEEVIGRTPEGTAKDVNLAVEAGGSHYPVIPERSATLRPWLPVPAAANKLR